MNEEAVFPPGGLIYSLEMVAQTVVISLQSTETPGNEKSHLPDVLKHSQCLFHIKKHVDLQFLSTHSVFCLGRGSFSLFFKINLSFVQKINLLLPSQTRKKA